MYCRLNSNFINYTKVNFLALKKPVIYLLQKFSFLYERKKFAYPLLIVTVLTHFNTDDKTGLKNEKRVGITKAIMRYR